jgi:hypothetical protein
MQLVHIPRVVSEKALEYCTKYDLGCHVAEPLDKGPIMSVFVRGYTEKRMLIVHLSILVDEYRDYLVSIVESNG